MKKYSLIILLAATISSMAQTPYVPNDSTAISNHKATDSIPHYEAIELGGSGALIATAGNPADTLASKRLDEIVVTAELLKRKGNEDIITVTKAMREGTRNAGELLGRVSGVFYNPLTTELQYMGSKNILILVDGVEKGAGYIKRLRPERFDKITITNMPTGIYAGYDAVIDLHTRPLYTGYEGVVLTEAVIVPGDRNGDGDNLRKSRNEGQFTYTREKFNIDVTASYTFGQHGLSDYFNREYPLNGLKETTLETPDKSPDKHIRSNRYSAEVAADYDINRRHSVSAKISLAPSSDHDRYDYRIKRDFTDLNITDIVYESQRSDIRDRLDVLAGLWYRGRAAGWRLNANLTYTNIGYKRCNSTDRSSGYQITDNRDISSRYFTGGLEAKRQSDNQKWVFTLSDDFILSSFTEDRAETGNRLSESNDFRNTFNASADYQITNKLSLGFNAGFSVFRNSYNTASDTHFTPKAGFQAMWIPSDNVFMRLNYAASTRYPALSRLQNYGQFTDSLMYSSGNPGLKPSLIHDISLTATFLKSISIEGRYTHTSDCVFSYFVPAYGVIPSGASTFYTRNGSVNGTSDRWSVNLTYSKAFGPHWQISLTGTLIGERAKYSAEASSKVLPQYDWYVLYQTMKGSLQFYLSGYMEQNALITPQSNMRDCLDLYALSVSKFLFNNRLQLLGMWYIPLHLTDGGAHGGITSPSYSTRYWADNNFRVNNMFQISVLYRFNGGKSVKKYDRQSETVDI